MALDITSYVIGKKKGGVQPTGEIDITQNGVTNVSGYATANVQVPEKQLEDKSITISTNTTTLIEPTQGKDGMSSVSVTTNIPGPSGKITITQNGTDIDVSSYATADVNVPAGIDPAEYFNTTLSGQTDPTEPQWYNTIKKIPEITMAIGRMKQFFKQYPGNEIPKVIIQNVNLLVAFDNCFESCATQNINISSWNLSALKGVRCMYMFYKCKAEKINASSFGEYNTEGSGISLSNMFQDSTALKEVDLSNFKIIQTGGYGVANINYMFSGCTSLEKIDMSNFDFTVATTTNVFTNVPTNCLILVKDQTQKDWFTTNWSSLTNVQIKSEYIANQGA